ncbi:MAG: hypothetical protein HZB80_01730 [Deltaproteobacteria bacterium]|nr:hypothetical protein [Deltaproteobacteria bacterium]
MEVITTSTTPNRRRIQSGCVRVPPEIIEAVHVNRKSIGVGYKTLAKYLGCCKERIRKIERGLSQGIPINMYPLYKRLAHPTAPAWRQMTGMTGRRPQAEVIADTPIVRLFRKDWLRLPEGFMEKINANRGLWQVGKKRLAKYLGISHPLFLRLESRKSDQIHKTCFGLIKDMLNPDSPRWQKLSLVKSAHKPKHQSSYFAATSKESFVKEPEARFEGQTRRDISVVVDLSYRPEKFRVRKILLELLKKHTEGDISALTLPGTEWLLERDIVIYGLSTGRKTDVTGIENHRLRYNLGRLNMEALQSAAHGSSIQFVHTDMEDFLGNHSYYKGATASYNFVWLDWMGYVCKSHLASYWKILKNLRLPAVVACTFMRAREHSEEQALYNKCLELYGAEIPSADIRGVTIPMILTALAAAGGCKTEVVMNDHYREMGKNTPMAVVAVKITEA